MNKTPNNHFSFYITEEQDHWLEEMAKLNNKSKSYFVRLAIEVLQREVGGIPDGI